MENASKALFIAGTLLILILVISALMNLFSGAGNLNRTVQSKLSADEINAFNDQFRKYEETQRGSRVKELITAVNKSNERSDVTVSILSTYYVSKDSNGIYYPKSTLLNTDTYIVSFGRDEKSNIITSITIEK